MAAYAKYDGIDGESKDTNHDKWIDVLSIDWGVNRPGGGATGQSRRRGGAVVDDITLTIEYEKSTPLLQEKCCMGEIISPSHTMALRAGRSSEPRSPGCFYRNHHQQQTN